jgi:hypothetical protein
VSQERKHFEPMLLEEKNKGTQLRRSVEDYKLKDQAARIEKKRLDEQLLAGKKKLVKGL